VLHVWVLKEDLRVGFERELDHEASFREAACYFNWVADRVGFGEDIVEGTEEECWGDGFFGLCGGSGLENVLAVGGRLRAASGEELVNLSLDGGRGVGRRS